jgi:hypothetical protein
LSRSPASTSGNLLLAAAGALLQFVSPPFTSRQLRTRAVCSASMRWSPLRVDSAAMLEPTAPSRNSLRALRALRSNRRAEFDDEARCARGPRILRFSAPHRRAATCPGTPLRDRW